VAGIRSNRTEQAADHVIPSYTSRDGDVKWFLLIALGDRFFSSSFFSAGRISSCHVPNIMTC
jgi:hypothetical protein